MRRLRGEVGCNCLGRQLGKRYEWHSVCNRLLAFPELLGIPGVAGVIVLMQGSFELIVGLRLIECRARFLGLGVTGVGFWCFNDVMPQIWLYSRRPRRFPADRFTG